MISYTAYQQKYYVTCKIQSNSEIYTISADYNNCNTSIKLDTHQKLNVLSGICTLFAFIQKIKFQIGIRHQKSLVKSQKH